MAGKKGASGGVREGAGRKSKGFEKSIKDNTEPYIQEAIETVLNVMRNADKFSDQLSAAKTILEYNWGKPKQQTDVTTNGDSVNIPILMWADDSSES